MSDQSCLKRHLLYASVQAYHPGISGYSSAPPRWLAAPAGVGAPSIDFALVGRFAEGIVIAFRGTLPPLDLTPDTRSIVGPPFNQWLVVVQDWLNNLHAVPAADAPTGGRPALPGHVHPGFARSLDRLWPGIAAAVESLRVAGEAPRLYFTGHSKGGALANLAALCARQTWPEARVKVATFGAPRAGDAAFAQAYSAGGIDCQRFEADHDVVPNIPPGAVAVGEGHGLASVTFPAPLSRILHFGQIFVPDDRGMLPLRIAAHLPYRDFGYDKHIYEDGTRQEWS